MTRGAFYLCGILAGFVLVPALYAVGHWAASAPTDDIAHRRFTLGCAASFAAGGLVAWGASWGLR